MIFNNGGHHIKKFKFHFGTSEISTTQKYCYLGIVFTSSGLFTEAIKCLYDKAAKTFFLLRQLNIRDNVKLSLKLFNSLVSPILFYGCEVWAPFLFKNLKSDNFQTLSDSTYIEKINVKLCKYILGVNKNATNTAVKAELGQFPLCIKALQLSLKYWHRFYTVDPNSLVKKAYIESLMTIHTKHIGWSSCIHNLLKTLDLEDTWNNQNEESFVNYIFLKQKMEKLYADKWKDNIKHSTKLKTFANIKTDFKLEQYLLHFPVITRRNFTRIRISSHHLAVEIGRYTKPLTPYDNRLCHFCYFDCIEDEQHFLFECPYYASERDFLFSQLDFLDIDFTNTEYLFVTLMSTMDYDVCSILCNYINVCIEKRNQFFVKNQNCYSFNKNLASHVEFLRLSQNLAIY
jgi:hypothetical protein